MTAGRLHRSARIVDGPRETDSSIIVTWAPGTPIAMVEEGIKAAARVAITGAREQFHKDTQEAARG